MKQIENFFEEGDPLDRLELIEDDSDDSDEYDEDGEGGNRDALGERADKAGRKVTFDYFVETLWPIMFKNRPKLQDEYSASSIFREIFSYTKGSHDSVDQPKGRLTFEEYDGLGRKVAGGFRGESEGFGSRNEVYELFE